MPSTYPNPPNSDPPDWLSAGHSYYSLNYFFKQKFGEKILKISLDAGLNCPNRDGVRGTQGCVFCDPESFSPSRRQQIPEIARQLEEGMTRALVRRPHQKFLAYFQPASNTYGPIERLRACYEEVLRIPQIVGIAVGTRPDCVPNEILDLLAEYSRRAFLMVEYGLQSSHLHSLIWMNRGHSFDDFVDAMERSRDRRLNVGVHLILGLPGETRDDMLDTIRKLGRWEIHSVKFHNLYAVRNTRLAELVERGEVHLPEFEEYVGWLVDCLEHLSPRVVIDRLSGDAPEPYFLGPAWCLKKTEIKRAVEEEFRRRGSHQGIRAEGFCSASK